MAMTSRWPVGTCAVAILVRRRSLLRSACLPRVPGNASVARRGIMFSVEYYFIIYLCRRGLAVNGHHNGRPSDRP